MKPTKPERAVRLPPTDDQREALAGAVVSLRRQVASQRAELVRLERAAAAKGATKADRLAVKEARARMERLVEGAAAFRARLRSGDGAPPRVESREAR